MSECVEEIQKFAEASTDNRSLSDGGQGVANSEPQREEGSICDILEPVGEGTDGDSCCRKKEYSDSKTN